jgi:hypothetical protein
MDAHFVRRRSGDGRHEADRLALRVGQRLRFGAAVERVERALEAEPARERREDRVI